MVNPKEYTPVRGYFRKKRHKKMPLKLCLVLIITCLALFALSEYPTATIATFVLGLSIFIAINWKKWKRNRLYNKLHKLEETEKDRRLDSEISQYKRSK